MVNVPVLYTLATALPEMEPNSAEAKIETLAGPPLERHEIQLFAEHFVGDAVVPEDAGQILPAKAVGKERARHDDQRQPRHPARRFQHEQDGGGRTDGFRVRHGVHIPDAFHVVVDVGGEEIRGGEGPADQDQIQCQPAGVFPLAFLKLFWGEVEEDQSEHDPQMDGAQQLGVDDPEPGGKIDLEDGQTDSDNAGNALQ